MVGFVRSWVAWYMVCRLLWWLWLVGSWFCSELLQPHSIMSIVCLGNCTS